MTHSQIRQNSPFLRNITEALTEKYERQPLNFNNNIVIYGEKFKYYVYTIYYIVE